MEERVVSIDTIEVKGRARQEFSDLQDLAESIKKTGIVNPLSVFPLDAEETRFRLIAGERRLRAAEIAEVYEVPIRVWPRNISTIEVKRIELEENLHRKDLTFGERAKLSKEIYEMEVEIYGKKSPGASTGEVGSKGASLSTVAKKIGVAKSTLHEDIKLAEAMEEIPELAEAKNRSEALRILNRMETKVIAEELAEKMEKERASADTDEVKERLIEAFRLGDFFEKVKEVPDESVDLCEVDPPYGVDIRAAMRTLKDEYGERYQSMARTMEYEEVDKQDYPSFLARTYRECFRVTKPGGWIVAWFATGRWDQQVRLALESAGYSIATIPAVWTKQSTNNPNPKLILTHCYETFFYGYKPGAPTAISKQGRMNVFDYNYVPSARRIHPLERPIEMLEDVLSTFTPPASTIMVPFLGSGNTLLAAHNYGCRAFGFELSEDCRNNYIIRVNSWKVGERFESYGKVKR